MIVMKINILQNEMFFYIINVKFHKWNANLYKSKLSFYKTKYGLYNKCQILHMKCKYIVIKVFTKNIFFIYQMKIFANEIEIYTHLQWSFTKLSIFSYLKCKILEIKFKFLQIKSKWPS